MKPVRLGIIGMGNIGGHHAKYLLAGAVSNAVLTAVASTSVNKLDSFRDQGVKVFGGGFALIQSGAVDAVLIATPHFQHASLGMAAFKAGLHVLVEKPIAAHKADAERLLAVRREHPKLVFSAMFQMRADPRYRQIKEIIATGQLGEMVRVSWIVTEWFRTQAYYASGGWRATWAGEGGGVLINQCLHQLDMLQWLAGLPSRVRSFVQLGRFHQIEVEDEVTAFLEFPSGATGTLVASTGESPGTNRLEISGSLGKILLENDQLFFFRNESSMLEFSRTATTGFARPPVQKTELAIPADPDLHALVTQNFIDSIVQGTPLLAPGEEGLASIELANALLLSGLEERTISLPLDGLAYEKKLAGLIASSTLEKKVIKTSSDDFARSFMR